MRRLRVARPSEGNRENGVQREGTEVAELIVPPAAISDVAEALSGSVSSSFAPRRAHLRRCWFV